jgi:glycosyltransferase involved in cell wall biosynthesis
MPRVLHLAHHYPPIGGVVGRNLDLSRYLPEFGYDPTVVTAPEDSTKSWSWAPMDEQLARRVGETRVLRVAGPVPGPATGPRARVGRWLERPTPRARWWIDGAAQTGVAIGERFDVILANLLPLETAFAAARLSRELGIPWIADLDDPWAIDEMRVAPTYLNYRIDLHRMRTGLSTASALVMSCQEAAVRLRHVLPELADRSIEPVPHGFNRGDYEGERPQRADGAFRIVHTGSLHTELGLEHRRTARVRKLLGGTSVEVDIHTRSHVYLLEAIDRLRRSHPDLGHRVELHLIGKLSGADRAAIERYDCVRTYGHLSHPETVAMARSADLLFLPMHELPPGKRAGIVPCKTYEYLAAERPILAAVPDGDCRDLLAQVKRASLVRPSDVTGMTAALRERIADPERGVGSHGLDSELLAPYERRHMTRRIAAVMDGVLGVRSARPVAA